MEEIKYFKEYQHNYLILKCDGTGAGESYQSRMLMSGKIERMLKCSIRHINGETFFYYDITSRVTLENLYRGKKISYEQVRDLFRQLDIIYRTLEEFFMEEAGLLVRPNCIYYDLSSAKYLGLYYPGKNRLPDNPYEPLMDFLLNHTDTGNRSLTDVLYRIYEMTEDPFFSVADALALLEEEEEEPSAEADKMEECVWKQTKEDDGAGRKAVQTSGKWAGRKKEITLGGKTETAVGITSGKKRETAEEKALEGRMETAERKASGERMEITAADDGEEYCTVPEAWRDYDEEEQPCVAQKKNRMFYGIFAALSVCGIAAAVWLFLHFVLTERETLLLICCSGVMGLCFLFSVIQLLLSGKKDRKKEQEERALLWDIEDEFREERPVAIQDVLDRNMDIEAQRCLAERNLVERNLWKSGQAERNRIVGNPAENRENAGASYGETVFIDMRKRKAEYKLYSLDKKNKKHIDLNRFPFSIGKMPGCVDCVLSDDSVSRLHARLEKQGDKILLTDMNSTNGTYKNGLRMEPSETVEIEPGDEIRFGKLNYCYR